MKCKFCGGEVHEERYLSKKAEDSTCGRCTSYCLKKCELGKSGRAPGWHFEPCKSCERNPYKSVKEEAQV